jgi:hypothetical protein
LYFSIKKFFRKYCEKPPPIPPLFLKKRGYFLPLKKGEEFCFCFLSSPSKRGRIKEGEGTKNRRKAVFGFNPLNFYKERSASEIQEKLTRILLH